MNEALLPTPASTPATMLALFVHHSRKDDRRFRNSERGEDGDGREAIVGSNEIWPKLHRQQATQLLRDTTPKRRLSLNDVRMITKGFSSSVKV